MGETAGTRSERGLTGDTSLLEICLFLCTFDTAVLSTIDTRKAHQGGYMRVCLQ